MQQIYQQNYDTQLQISTHDYRQVNPHAATR